MTHGATKGPWGTPVLRNTLMFSITARQNHRSRMNEHPNIDDRSEVRTGEQGLMECEEIIAENESDKATSSGYPRCGCPNPSGEYWPGTYPGCCWPQIIVQNNLAEEYIIVQITPEHYAGLTASTPAIHRKSGAWLAH